MGWVENLKLRNKLLVVLVLPLACLFLLSGYLLKSELESRDDLEQLVVSGQLSIAVTALVHQLQIERGRSGVYLAAAGEVFSSELVDQRLLTDQAWQQLQMMLSPGRLKFEGVLSLPLLHAARSGLEQLRNGIDQQVVSDIQAVDQYSDLNQRLLNALLELSTYTSDGVLTRMLTGLINLVTAKEAAGLERAEGSRLLAAGKLSPDSIDRLRELMVEQRVLISRFLNQSPKAIGSYFNDRMDADCVRRLITMRVQATDESTRGQLSTNDWFETTSCRISRLREVELQFARHIDKTVQTLLDAGKRRTITLILLTLLPIIPSFLIIMLVARNVSNVTRWLLNSMHGIASGNFNVTLPSQSRDELGELSAGMDRLRMQLAGYMAQQNQAIAQERETNEKLARRSAEIQIFAQSVAAGDLRRRLNEEDETLNQLAQGLNQMAAGLAGMTRDIRESGVTLATTVTDVQSTVTALSSGATQQACSVNETMATLDQIKAVSSQTLEKASALGEVAERARHEGALGRKVVEESISGMSEVRTRMDAIGHTILALNEWTQRIGEITRVVNDVARQLRLISLNAAIEAAKAGEAGKGFAVVAGEVKQLAEQSQSATGQVQKILEEIRHATDRAVMAAEEGNKGMIKGLVLVERTGEVIRGLEAVVSDTSTASRQIVTAVNQEVTGIEQITTAVTEIHSVTQQFVGAAAQSREVVKDLAYLVERLESGVQRYRL